MKQLKELRENNKDLEVLFIFLDNMTKKMIKSSVADKDENTLVFCDYNDDAEYYVPISKANNILNQCYNDFFFKVILSNSNFYIKVKKISLDLKVEAPVFNLFFRNLFMAIKYTFSVICNDYEYNKSTVSLITDSAFEDYFIVYPKVSRKNYSKKSKLILKKLEELNILSYKTNDVTKDKDLQAYFDISTTTFRFFSNTRQLGFESFFPVFEFFDLRLYINNQDCLKPKPSLLKKLDRSIQKMTLICFNEVRFLNNPFIDNSYIKEFNQIRSNKNKDA